MIHIIGNSHASMFTGNSNMIPFVFEDNKYINHIENIKAYRFCNTLAYNLYNKDINEIIKFIHTLNLREEDSIALLFGEVDCRWWIPYYSSTNNVFISDVITSTTESYLSSFLEIKKTFSNRLVFISTHPSTTDEHCSDKDKPVFRECLYRNFISREFNNKMKNICKNNEIINVEVFNEILTKDGMTNMMYFKDYCHLDDKCMPMYIEQFKQKNLL